MLCCLLVCMFSRFHPLPPCNVSLTHFLVDDFCLDNQSACRPNFPFLSQWIVLSLLSYHSTQYTWVGWIVDKIKSLDDQLCYKIAQDRARWGQHQKIKIMHKKVVLENYPCSWFNAERCRCLCLQCTVTWRLHRAKLRLSDIQRAKRNSWVTVAAATNHYCITDLILLSSYKHSCNIL